MLSIFKRIGFCLKVTWQLGTVFVQMLRGAWRLGKLPRPVVTIFGGHLLPHNSTYAQLAHQLAHRLIQENISVITGGGPGIMRAAGCGATHQIREGITARSIGITVEGLGEKMAQECAQEYFIMPEFFARKWLMINYSVAFAVFPGGFGTLDEFAEVITLIHTKKLPGVPVVLFGKDYWKHFIEWMHKSALHEGLITNDDINLIHVTDDIDEALLLLKERCQTCNMPVEKLKKRDE
ncbi:MAG: TIGR00730 family Rossman fold protein [Candidatus Babeliales bacterium]